MVSEQRKKCQIISLYTDYKVTKGKTDAEKKKLKRNKKKSKQWLYFNGSRALGPTPTQEKG